MKNISTPTATGLQLQLWGGMALTALFYGSNAAGLVLWEDARALRPPRDAAQALRDALGCGHRLLLVLLAIAVLAAAGLGVVTVALWLTRLPWLGPALFGLLLPAAVLLVGGALLAGVDVFKNVAANQIEGGIAGTVNLRTRVPFDIEDHLIAFNADYNYGDLSDKGFWSGSLLGSDRWDTPIGEIGFLANISISNVGNTTNSISVDRYDPVVLNAGNAPSDGSAAAGDTVYIPKFMGWRTIEWEQTRNALAFALQWEPNDQWMVTLQGLGSEAKAYNVEYALGSESILSPNNT